MDCHCCVMLIVDSAEFNLEWLLVISNYFNLFPEWMWLVYYSWLYELIGLSQVYHYLLYINLYVIHEHQFSINPYKHAYVVTFYVNLCDLIGNFPILWSIYIADCWIHSRSNWWQYLSMECENVWFFTQQVIIEHHSSLCMKCKSVFCNSRIINIINR